MSKYDELLEELEVMAKSMEAGADEDDDREGDDLDGDGDGEEDEAEGETESKEKGEAESDDEDGEEFGKSFVMKMENGEEIEAVDGTALVKSLMSRLDETETSMGQALKQTVALVSKQSELIKSLQSEVRSMATSGRGRRTVVNVHEKQPLTKSDTDADTQKGGLTVGEVMAKAIDAQKSGRITGTDVAVAEAHLNRGSTIPDRILTRIMG